MSKTKTLGVLGLIGAAAAIGVDIFDGDGFNIEAHASALGVAFGSLGLIFLRDAMQKVIDISGSRKLK